MQTNLLDPTVQRALSPIEEQILDPAEVDIFEGGAATQSAPTAGIEGQDLLKDLVSALNSRDRETFGSRDRKAFDFDASFEKYKNRLAPYLSTSPRPTLYDLASDIGAALLSSDPTAGTFRGVGIGFSNFNKRLKKDKENRRLLDRQIGLQAMQMAMADEKAATDYLNELEIKRIELLGKPYDPLIYEFPDPKTGEIKTIEVDPRNPIEVAAIRSVPGAKQIRLPESQINIDQRPESYGAKEASKTLNELESQWAADAKAANSQNQLTNMFLLQLTRLGEDGFGQIQSRTLGVRTFLDDLGIRYDDSIPDQQLVNTLGTRIAMGLVGQTKGAITEMEMRLFLAASPTLASTYEGALKQATLLQRIANLNSKKAEDWSRDAENVLSRAETAEARLRAARAWEIQWQKNNPFLTAEETSELRKFAAQETEQARILREAMRPESSDTLGLKTDFSD